ncbi:MAG TPA: FeoB-associated Cys-rich membrane protein [Firmicutes bacterium]|nr:FeoB-associated Cys-rich membrane protein [Bacillota bacterium]
MTYGGSLLIGLAVLAIVALIVRKLYRDRKRGRSSCGCGCDHCPSAGACHGHTERKP